MVCLFTSRLDGVIRQAIYALKYRHLKAMAVPLARLLREYLSASPVPGEVLIPVPLHRKRLRERGYNQSDLLARELSKLTGLPVINNYLFRKRQASPQAVTSSVEERRSNVGSAFACHDHGLQDKQVLLIDDVSTSGATIDVCAVALKAVGVAYVWGLVLAGET